MAYEYPKYDFDKRQFWIRDVEGYPEDEIQVFKMLREKREGEKDDPPEIVFLGTTSGKLNYTAEIPKHPVEVAVGASLNVVEGITLKPRAFSAEILLYAIHDDEEKGEDAWTLKREQLEEIEDIWNRREAFLLTNPFTKSPVENCIISSFSLSADKKTSLTFPISISFEEIVSATLLAPTFLWFTDGVNIYSQDESSGKDGVRLTTSPTTAPEKHQTWLEKIKGFFHWEV